MPHVDQTWKRFLGDDLIGRWQGKASGLYGLQQQVYPQRENVFRAFNECPFGELKVVIVGEAPYPNENANGLAFSVQHGKRLPPSLCTILSEVLHDLDIDVKHDGDLTRWARQGVLLLNSSLTIGHTSRIMWGLFTSKVLKAIHQRKCRIVFMLWGSRAVKRGSDLNDHNGHLVLKSSHPSPISNSSTSTPLSPFRGCQHFLQASDFLANHGKTVDWR